MCGGRDEDVDDAPGNVFNLFSAMKAAMDACSGPPPSSCKPAGI